MSSSLSTSSQGYLFPSCSGPGTWKRLDFVLKEEANRDLGGTIKGREANFVVSGDSPSGAFGCHFPRYLRFVKVLAR